MVCNSEILELKEFVDLIGIGCLWHRYRLGWRGKFGRPIKFQKANGGRGMLSARFPYEIISFERKEKSG